MSNPVASVEIQAKSTGLVAQLREARAKFGTFADGVNQGMDRAFAKLYRGKKGKDGKGGGFLGKGSFLGDAARTGAGNLMSSAVSSVVGGAVDMGKSVFDFEERLTRLRIAAGQTPEVMREWSDEMRKASDATGIKKDEVLGAAEAYVRLTGDVDTARKQTMMFSKVAQATGSNVSEIAETAAALGQNLKVPAEQFEAMFSALSVQGKAGAIELKDMAAELSTIAPQWAQFSGGTGAKGVRELGAAMQIVKKGFGGDAGETTVGVSNFLTAISKKSKQLGGKGTGVNGFFTVDANGKKSLKDVFTIIDLISKSKIAKDPATLQKAFGSIEAYRAYIQLRDNRMELEKLAEAGKDAGSIQRDFDDYMGSSAGRAKKSWEEMKNSIADAFTPERIEAFVSGLQAALKVVTAIVDGLDAAFSAIDLDAAGTKMREKTAKDSLRGTEQLSNEEKQKKAAQLRAEAKKLAGATDPIFANQREGMLDAADALTGQADKWDMTSRRTGGEIMAMAAGRASLAADPKKAITDAAYGLGLSPELAKQIVDELKKINSNTAAGTKVDVDGNTIAKSSKNAASHRGKVAR